jgi:hypothetical protein
MRQIDFAHAAGAEVFDYLVGSQLCSRRNHRTTRAA